MAEHRPKKQKNCTNALRGMQHLTKDQLQRKDKDSVKRNKRTILQQKKSHGPILAASVLGNKPTRALKITERRLRRGRERRGRRRVAKGKGQNVII